MLYPFLIGSRTCNQVTTPLVYDESLSITQQIAIIMGKLNAIDTDYIDAAEFDSFKQQLAATLDALEKAGEKYTDDSVEALKRELTALIASLQIGLLVWNVTLGKYTDNVESMRDFFNDVTVHAITVDELANLELNVDQLANCGLNVRGLAVFSGYLIGENFTPEGIMYNDTPADGKITCAILANGEVKDGYFVEGGN